jgi:hypothetical protein
MKTTIFSSVKSVIVLIIFWACINNVSAQLSKENDGKPTVAIAGLQTANAPAELKIIEEFIRTQLVETGQFRVLEPVDVQAVMKKNNIDQNCSDLACLCQIGEMVNADKVFSGQFLDFGKKISVTFRCIDVKTKKSEREITKEFLDLPGEMTTMIRMTIREMYEMPVDKFVLDQLTQKNTYETSLNNPNLTRIAAGGPRMGFTCFTGPMAKRLAEKTNVGGFNAYPVMFQFGYQLEQQYLNEGKFQALMEFVPMVTGLDQGYFIPSLTIMNGLRSNANGLEFAFGPTFSLVREAKGYWVEGEWMLAKDVQSDTTITQNYFRESRIDSRGDYELNTGFVFAIGKTFRSGRLNIPVNAYVMPNREGVRFGISLGYNASNRKVK